MSSLDWDTHVGEERAGSNSVSLQVNQIVWLREDVVFLSGIDAGNVILSGTTEFFYTPAVRPSHVQRGEDISKANNNNSNNTERQHRNDTQQQQQQKQDKTGRGSWSKEWKAMDDGLNYDPDTRGALNQFRVVNRFGELLVSSYLSYATGIRLTIDYGWFGVPQDCKLVMFGKLALVHDVRFNAFGMIASSLSTLFDKVLLREDPIFTLSFPVLAFSFGIEIVGSLAVEIQTERLTSISAVQRIEQTASLEVGFKWNSGEGISPVVSFDASTNVCKQK